jgi:imidazolonepropionase-like amidohydrolase
MKKIFCLLLLISPVLNAQNKSVLIMNATAHLGNDSVIASSLIGIIDGKIALVADAANARIDRSSYQEVIDASGKHVYPGMIAPNTTIGLTEIEAVRATNDFRETGTSLPNVRSIIAYNTDSKIIPTVRTNGVLMAQITPRGGLVSGSSSIVCLDGWNWEDAAYKTDDGMHINWPRLASRKYQEEESASPPPFEKNKYHDQQLDELTRLFSDAKAYKDSEEKPEANLRFESLRGLFEGTQSLFVHTNSAREMMEAISFCKRFSITKMVIVGGRESWMIAKQLKENNIAVMVSRVHDLPERTDEDVDQPYKLPYLLQKEGVLFCLNNEGDMEAMGARNLPFMAGTAAAYGLTKEQALRAVTLNTAKILGIDQKTGSIETGKDATLFISTGDALDMRSNNVERAFVRGVEIDLNNDQKMLYEKYKSKYGIK